MAKLRLTFRDLYRVISEYLGWTNEPTDQQLETVKDLVHRGYRQFLYPIDIRTGQYYEWSFLRVLHTINLVSDKWKYQLPEDFSSIITDPTYKDDENFKKMTKVPPEQIMNLRAAGVVDYAPYYYSIVPTTYDIETGSFDEIWFYPEPDSSYPIQFFYKADPSKLSNDDDYLVGGVKASEAIIESCLAKAEQHDDNTLNIHTQLAEKLIQDLIQIDSQRGNDSYLGNLYDSKGRLYIERTDIASLDIYPDA